MKMIFKRLSLSFIKLRKDNNTHQLAWAPVSDIWFVEDFAEEFLKLEFLILALLRHIFPWAGDWKIRKLV